MSSKARPHDRDRAPPGHEGSRPRARGAGMHDPQTAGRMSASDGHSLTTDLKKKAPHFDNAWYRVLNDAITRGTGVVEDTESERRAVIAERERAAEQSRGKKRASALKSVGASFVVRAWDATDPGETWEAMQEQAEEYGWEWEPL